MTLNIYRQLIGLEDLLVGFKSESQNRGGDATEVNGITAAALGGVQVVDKLTDISGAALQKLANVVVFDLSTRSHYKYNRVTAQWENLATVAVAAEAAPQVREVEVVAAPMGVTTYSSVHELPREATTGDFAVVTGDRGGIFVFNEAEKDSYDGGVIFYGWRRQFNGWAKASWYEKDYMRNLFNHTHVYVDTNIGGETLVLGVHNVRFITGDGKHTLGTAGAPVSILGALTQPLQTTAKQGQIFVPMTSLHVEGDIIVNGTYTHFMKQPDGNGALCLRDVIEQAGGDWSNNNYRVSCVCYNPSTLEIDFSVKVYFKHLENLISSKIACVKAVKKSRLKLLIHVDISFARDSELAGTLLIENCDKVNLGGFNIPQEDTNE